MQHFISATIALALLSGTAAIAQHDYQNNQQQNSAPQNNRGNSGGQNDRQGFDRAHSDQPHWSRGDRLPDNYRQDQYVVTDWQGNHLRKPPRGHHWVRRNNQFILVAIGTGLIASAIINNQ